MSDFLINADLVLNTKILLRRAEFDDACILDAGEPGYHTGTKVFKIGDGTTAWKDLPFANKGQVELILANYYTKGKVDELLGAAEEAFDGKLEGYKTLQEVIAAVQTETNVFVDTVAQDANGVVTITTKSVDFSAADDRFKKLQTAVEAVATAKNVFIEKIAQDAQGVITISTKAVDFSDYRTAADQDLIDATFKTKQTAVNKTGSTSKTITAVTQNENGEIDITFGDIAFPAQTDYTVTCTDEEVEATESAGAYKRHTLTQNGQTVCTIDIPRDLVIKSGSVDKETNELVLVLVNDEEIRVDVFHLIEYVTGATAADGVITINISDDFVATATINDGTITSAKFAAEVDEYVDGRIEDKAKLKQTAYSATGDTKKTITSVTQNENGEITVAYSDIDFSHNHDTQYKVLQTAIDVVETEANEFIDTVAQDAQGVVTITTKKVDFSAAIQEAKDYADSLDHEDTTYVVAPTANALEFTVTPEGKGEAQTVTLVAPIVDTGVMSVTAGASNNDITVNTTDGAVTVAHKDYQTGTVKDAIHDSATDPSFVTGITIENGHVTGATVQNLKEVLKGMTIVLDGGTLKIG